MKKNLFLNLTVHTLTKKQIQRAKQRFKVIDFINIKEDYQELFEELSNLKINSDIDELCCKLFEYINGYTPFYDIIYIHMPCGSPFFQAKFFHDFLKRIRFNGDVRFIFSFSERKVVENEINGKVEKKVIFDFVDFQIL